MALTSGTRLGVYEVTAQIGAGGMGEVYRATDINLKRSVAIKVLSASVAGDADRLARLQREAEVLAVLNHPNIGAIYGLEKTAEFTALVMELVEGEDLSRRIARGAIPVHEVLPIAKQIADALEAAHDQGIIHRDLKPANIKVRQDGTVKILDFGLAKAIDRSGGSSTNAMNSPTLSMHATQAGIILGTAAYMSPEQAAGKPVDKRSDLWAFGVVVFEMLTGHPVFTGETVSHVLASVLKSEPSWRALPSDTPAPLQRMLRRCLEKDRARRLDSAADARLDIEEARGPETGAGNFATTESKSMPPVKRDIGSTVPWAIAALSILLTVAAGVLKTRDNRAIVAAVPLTRFELATPPTDEPLSFAISPDGRYVVFAATIDSVARLWLRPLDRASASPLPGTEGATYPFWAPDSRAIAFFADRKLKRVDLDGGTSQALTDAPAGRGGTWNRHGIIVFVPSTQSPLTLIPASGGTARAVLPKLPGQGNVRWPQFLPDDQHFLFGSGLGRPDVTGVYIGSLDGTPSRRLLPSDTAALFAPPDHLLVVRQGALVALRFDPVHFVVSDEPQPIAADVAFSGQVGRGAFAVSNNGVLLHRGGTILQRRQLVWSDRTGRNLGSLVPPQETGLARPELSMDGRRALFYRIIDGNDDVWTVDALRGVLTRLTIDSSNDTNAVWAPDMRRVVFRSNRSGHYDLFEKAADGSGDETTVWASPEDKVPWDISPDGSLLLYGSVDPKDGRQHLLAVPLVGDRKPFTAAPSHSDDEAAQFSPDGNWIAYQSNQSGRTEVYVQSFPGAGEKVQVSLEGGSQVRWRRDGKELFFVGQNEQMMVVTINADAKHGGIAVGTPQSLFPTHLSTGINVTNGATGAFQQYAVAPDGRFLLNTVVVPASSSPLTVILNWTAALTK